MMRLIVGWSLRFRVLVVAIAAGTLVLGVTQLRSMPIDVLPELTPPYVEVQTEALGLSAEEVEQLVTVPLEADLLNGVAWLDEIRSESIPGLSSIVMTFEPGTDIFRARQMVAERLTQAFALPNVSKPSTMLQPLSSENRIMIVGLRSDEMSLIDMSLLARWTMRPRLMGVPGVANVSIWGQREHQLQVLVDPRDLQASGVSLDHVIRTTGNALWVSPLTFLEASTPGTGGFVETPNQRLGIQHILPISSPEDLARVVVEQDDPAARTLRLGDVSTVVVDHQPLIGDAVVADGEGLLLVIEKFPEVNTLDVTRNVDAALDALKPGLAGIEVDPTVFRPATFIESSIGNVSIALLVGFLLVALVLGAILFDWRAALIGLLTIPLSLAAATAVLYLAGASLNLMVFAGLIMAIGVIVDDAATSVDAVLRRIRQPREGDGDRSKVDVVVEATLEHRSPIVYATAIILVALVPVLFVGGAISSFLPPLAAAYGLAVLASMVVALTVTPALAVLVLSRSSGDRAEPTALRWLGTRYRARLAAVLIRGRSPLFAGGVLVVGVFALIGLALAPQAGGTGLPTFNAREVVVGFEAAAGTSRAETSRVIAQASAELRRVPGVRNVGSHVGRAILSDSIVNVNSGEVWVTIDPAADRDGTIAAIRDAVEGYPGFATSLATYPEQRVDEILSGTEADVSVRVYGQDLATLGDRAEQVRQAVAGVDGVVDPTIGLRGEEPSIEVEVDLSAAEQYGVKAGDVRRAATTLLSGLEVGLLFEDQKVFEVVVWGVPELRTSLTSIQDLPIETPSGGTVRLGDVAAVRVASAPSVITREGVMRYLDVEASISGRDTGSVLSDIRSAVGAIEFPLEYHAEVFSPAAEREAALIRLLAVLVGAGVLAFLILQAALGSWRLAFFVFVTLPTAVIGGVLAGFATGGLVSIGSLAGLFTVLAISVRIGVSLISHYRTLERSDGGYFGPSLILQGAQERLGPTLITVAGTALAVLPFAVTGDVAGFEVARPMAIFVLGGLVSSTLVTLFVLPNLYLRSGPSPESDTESLLSEGPALEPAAA
jgi:CzcA family heavy metal efflux pump